MPELELATTDELLDELFGRFDHVVFCGAKLLDAAPRELFVRKVKGLHVMCAGLSAHMNHFILAEMETKYFGKPPEKI